MTYGGKVQNGVVVLDNGAEMADGTIVRVEPVQTSPESAEGAHSRLLALAGTLKGLPPDFAANHDHYIHGAPKR